MKKIATFLAVLIVGYAAYVKLHTLPQMDERQPTPEKVQAAASGSGAEAVVRAYNDRADKVEVHGSGRVVKVLEDDTEGLRHQRFLLRITPQLTVLVAHNLDVASRVPGLQSGDEVEFQGEYIWNQKGGVLHWTHRDLGGRHPSGWLKVNGKIYQ